MADYDLFELTKDLSELPFDAPDDKYVAAIKKAVRQFGSSESNPAKRAINLAKKEYLEGFLINGEINIAKFREAKDEKLRDVTNSFKATYKAIKAKTVTERFVIDCSVTSRLSVQTVREILSSNEVGFKIVEFDLKMPEYAKSNATLTEINNNLERLRLYGSKHSEYSELTRVRDLYDFIAYLKGNIDDAEDYRGESNIGSLTSILADYERRNPGAPPDPIKICVEIAAPASKTIFTTKENKDIYDNYLKFTGSEMSEILSRIKALTEDMLRKPEVADALILKIEQIFDNKNHALAIYNNVAGFMRPGKVPYVFIDVQYYAKCGHCGDNLAFASETEKNNAQNCRNCSKPLYQQCRRPNCGAKVLVALDKCPKCQFVFASAAEFARHFAKADEFRRKGDFESARQSLTRASSADPGEKTKVSELEERIAKDERVYQEPVNKLRKLIAGKQFHTASSFLVQTINSFPMLNVASFEAEIKSTFAKAQSAFDSAKNRSSVERADICLDILNYCVDFQPALQYLKTTQPMAVTGLNLSIDSAKNNILVNWTRSVEKGITYCVVRKNGKDAPKNEREGELLGDEIGDTSYKDSSVSPGSYYSYAVFAKRMGVYSVPACITTLFVADVTNIYHEQNGTTLRITWLLPKNSIGVSISRNQNGKEVVLTENAQSSFEDKSTEYGKPYSYTLKANYFGLPSSRGVGFVVTILPKIDRFQISVVQVKDNRYKVGWKIDRKDIDLRVFVGNTPMRDLKSDKKDCEIEVPKDGFHTIKVAGFSGGEWLLSENSVEVNTYSSCEIDRGLSQIRENLITGANRSMFSMEFSIKIAGEIPNNVVAFWYVVRTKSSTSSGAPWATVSEIDTAHDVLKVPVENYKEKGELLYTAVAKDEDAYYVTMFTVYDVNGKEVISSPFKRKFERPLEARIVWRVSKPFLGIFGKWKLSMQIIPNRAISGHPKLVLCSSDSHLLSSDDVRAFVVHEIAETVFDSLYDSYSQEYELDSSKISTRTKLFLFEKSSNENERYSLIWADGFLGKV